MWEQFSLIWLCVGILLGISFVIVTIGLILRLDHNATHRQIREFGPTSGPYDLGVDRADRPDFTGRTFRVISNGRIYTRHFNQS